MDISLSSEIISFIVQVGVGNFLLVMFGLFAITTLPNLIDKILNRKRQSDRDKQQNERDKQYARDMSFIRTQIANVWEELKDRSFKIDSLKNSIDVQAQKVEGYNLISIDHDKQRVEENMSLVKSTIDIVNSINLIQKSMRNVMSEKDAMGLISLKFGSVEDFKTRLINKIMSIIDSGIKNGQREIDVKAIIKTEWSDLKTEFEAFRIPFDIRGYFDSLDDELWSDRGYFTTIKNITINDLEPQRKKETISQQLDMITRDIQEKLINSLKSNRSRHFE